MKILVDRDVNLLRLIGAIVGLLTGGTLLFIWFLWSIDQAQARAITAAPPEDWRPDIRHCLVPEVNSWDCIRGADDD